MDNDSRQGKIFFIKIFQAERKVSLFVTTISLSANGKCSFSISGVSCPEIIPHHRLHFQVVFPCCSYTRLKLQNIWVLNTLVKYIIFSHPSIDLKVSP